MASDRSPVPEPERQVLPFRRARAGAPPPDDLGRYQRSEGDDDYRHRMIVNALALLFVLALIGAGLWLADSMAQMRRYQDCVLSGRRGCTPVELNENR